MRDEGTLTPITHEQVPQAHGAWPLVGHARLLVGRPLEFFRTLPAYGDVVRIRLGPLPAYVITHPDLVHQVLVTEARSFSRGYVHDKGKSFLGEGLVTSSGELHRRHRRMLQPDFARVRVPRYVPTMLEGVRELTSRWRPDQPLEVTRETERLALTTVTRCLFAGLSEESAALTQGSVPVLMKGTVWRGVTPDWAARLPLPVNRRFQRASDDISLVVSRMIKMYRATEQEHSDVLTTLLNARDEEGRPLTDREIHDQVVTFYMAGVETTSAALAWTLHELARHRDVEERLHCELDTVLDGRDPAYEDLPRLTYLARIVNEVLRQYAIWFQMRRTVRPVWLGRVLLPAGAELIYSPHILHHDPRWFDDPDRFDPDRWLTSRTGRHVKHAFLPFGAGVHKCMGDNFALVQISLAIAAICSRWRLRPVPEYRVRKVIHATVHPDRLPMIPEHRHSCRSEP
ncbi:cytochrome P450 [Streptomyces sp. SudanB182_2057]|uniref:cytochrome P450 n=1 Tax=Streptomyces sp. SudanB182_2057 TaxID=3035281 RepID=UPI003F544C15